MKVFTIKDLEQLSGIKAHTIRIWEKRFNFLQPKRTKHNFRYYDNNNLKILLNIALLQQEGSRISQLANLESNSIKLRCNKLSGDAINKQYEIYKLIIAMYSYEVEQLEIILKNCIDTWGIGITIEDIIIPFIEKVQLFSYYDDNVETHFVVTAIRRKIILGIEELGISNSNKSVLIFLPEGVHFDLIILYHNYLFKRKGYTVLYLGTNISIRNLQDLSKTRQPEYLITYIVPRTKYKPEWYVELMEKHFPKSNLIITVGSKELMSPGLSKRIRFVNYIEVQDFINEN